MQGRNRPGYFCGIDLGTTNSTVSVIGIDKRSDHPLAFLKTLPIHQFNEHLMYEKDKLTLPSCLYFDIDDNRVYTGLYAKEMYGRGDRPMQTIRSVKTRIGGTSSIDIPSIKNPDSYFRFDMVQCSALFLKTIRNSLRAQLGEDVDEVVVTVPAAFNTDERRATRNAAFLAGFKHVDILDEPTAALLYYINGGEGDVLDDSSSEEGEFKMVYDIGGGTLDISIAKIQEDEDGDLDIDIRARSSRMDFGGDDFDQIIAAYFLYNFEKPRKKMEEQTISKENRIIAKIVSKAEEYKIQLNSKIQKLKDKPKRLAKESITVDFEIIDNMYILDEVLNKEIVDGLFKQIVKEKIIKPIEDALICAEISRDQLSEVLITGGMSKFFTVHDALSDFLGQDVKMTQIDSVKAVSKGAAMHHYSKYLEKLRKIKMKDIMSDDLFIKMGNEMCLFIPRTTQPGDKDVFLYKIPENGMTDLAIFLYSGIGDDPIAYTQLAGKYFPINRPFQKGESVEIEWRMDKEKILTLDIASLGETLKIANNSDFSKDKAEEDIINRLDINPF